MRIFDYLKKRKTIYYERDDQGRRADTLDLANRYFDSECVDPLDPPQFTLFLFQSKKAAEKAMMKLPFIHRAADTGKLICDLPITYGVYRVPRGSGYVAFILGSAISLEDFEKAEKVLSKRGTFKNHELPDGAKETFRVRYNRWTKEWVHYD